jgi:hypothetical protein
VVFNSTFTGNTASVGGEMQRWRRWGRGEEEHERDGEKKRDAQHSLTVAALTCSALCPSLPSSFVSGGALNLALCAPATSSGLLYNPRPPSPPTGLQADMVRNPH